MPPSILIEASLMQGFAEHTDEVPAEFGFTDAEIKRYRQTGAVE